MRGTGKYRALKAFLPLGLAVIFHGTAQAEITVEKNTHTYKVWGKSASKLVKEIEQSGPTAVSGKGRNWARTEWNVRYYYKYSYDKNSCWITSARAEVTLDYTMPKWANYEEGSARLQKSWDRTWAVLMEHEENHGQHGIDAGHEIVATIEKLKPRKDCNTLEEAAETTSQAIIKSYNKRDIAYDKQTNHGITEIPPLVD